MVAQCFVWMAALVADADEPRGQTAWRFVVPATGDAHEHPPPRAITLSNERPPDLRETAEYHGTERRYAQLRFGSPDSIRIGIVLDQTSPSQVDLYVDGNRNRIIETGERVPPIEGRDRTWRVPLDVAITEPTGTRFVRRELLFRLGTTARTLSYAVLGYLEGTVEIAGRRIAARRMDGDGNGFFTDPQDRLWLDLDGDGRWDPASEQFLISPVLKIGESRYVVRSDEPGTWLLLEPLAGIGKLRLALPARGEAEPPRVLQMAATLVGRDGSAISVSGTNREAEAPVGEYRLTALQVSLADPNGGLAWNFQFSGRVATPRWFRVDQDSVVEIDPIGRLELRTGFDDSSTCRAGEPLQVRPSLVTADGLHINAAFRGNQEAILGYKGPGARTRLQSTGGSPLDEANCGFV